MITITIAKLIDALLRAGVEVGLDRLADAVPAKLRDNVDALRREEAESRRLRMQFIVEEALQTAAAEFEGQTDEEGRSLTAWLEHEPFLVETVELLLLGDRPDVARLRTVFGERVADEQWQHLRRPLLRFLQELRRLLARDEMWGPLLSQYRMEASLAGIDRAALAVAERFDEVVDLVHRLPERTAAEIGRRLHPLDLNDLEARYLQGLYAECDAVPLAGDAPPDVRQDRQPRCFVEVGGYANQRLWSEEGWLQKKERGLSEPRWWNNRRLNHTSQPVVGVSWYEAVAYCRWLKEKWRTEGQIGKDEEVRLPTQAEWERTARSIHGGDYPWGGPFAPACANTEESGLAQTSPVHMYPCGTTPEGVWDLAGNVWEWTVNETIGGGHWLAGGARLNNADQVGASARLRSDPWYRDVLVGFRVVVVPITRRI